MPLLVAGLDAAMPARLATALADALPPDRRPEDGPGDDRLVRVADHLGPGTSLGILRAALGRTTGRSGLVATLDAGDLAGVLDILSRQGLAPDASSFLGVVLVVGAAPGALLGRVTVAHYLRPIVRDAGGHPHRLGPAVLAAHDDRVGGWEDFSWGIVPDLAERCRMRAPDFEAERKARAGLLADLATRGAIDRPAFEAATALRASPRPAPPGHRH